MAALNAFIWKYIYRVSPYFVEIRDLYVGEGIVSFMSPYFVVFEMLSETGEIPTCKTYF